MGQEDIEFLCYTGGCFWYYYILRQRQWEFIDLTGRGRGVGEEQRKQGCLQIYRKEGWRLGRIGEDVCNGQGLESNIFYILSGNKFLIVEVKQEFEDFLVLYLVKKAVIQQERVGQRFFGLELFSVVNLFFFFKRF